MKTILILANHHQGLYNFRREIIEALLNADFKVVISTPYGERINDLINMGCVYKETEQLNRHGTSVITDIKLFNFYKKLIKEVNPCVVLTYTIKPNIYGGLACKRLKVPYISNITGLGTVFEKGGLVAKLTTFLYKKSLSRVNSLFFQNKSNAEMFKDKGIAKVSHEILPGSGVNLNHYQFLDYPDDEKIVFVFISRVMKDKGIDEYLDAAKYLTSKYSNVNFHIYGFIDESKYEEKIQSLQKEGTIEYHGMLKDIREALKNSNATVHPSYHEGMSNVLLESAASGRPVIASEVSGCKETFDEGLTGYGFEVKNTNSLIDAIEKFISLPYDEKRKMGELGREKMIKEFDRKIIVKRYLEELHKIEGSK